MTLGDALSVTIGIAVGIFVSAAVAENSERLAEAMRERLRELRQEHERGGHTPEGRRTTIPTSPHEKHGVARPDTTACNTRYPKYSIV